MNLTPEAQQSLDFSKSCYLQGLCTVEEFMKAIKSIYQEDLEQQITFLVEQGFTRNGAVKHIYNLEKEEKGRIYGY